MEDDGMVILAADRTYRPGHSVEPEGEWFAARVMARKKLVHQALAHRIIVSTAWHPRHLANEDTPRELTVPAIRERHGREA